MPLTMVALPVSSPQGLVDFRVAHRGMRQGGRYELEQYCGVISIIIGVLICPCIQVACVMAARACTY
jgi:hypothetical protein